MYVPCSQRTFKICSNAFEGGCSGGWLVVWLAPTHLCTGRQMHSYIRPYIMLPHVLSNKSAPFSAGSLVQVSQPFFNIPTTTTNMLTPPPSLLTMKKDEKTGWAEGEMEAGPLFSLWFVIGKSFPSGEENITWILNLTEHGQVTFLLCTVNETIHRLTPLKTLKGIMKYRVQKKVAWQGENDPSSSITIQLRETEEGQQGRTGWPSMKTEVRGDNRL